jgi:hypothetical protein
VYATTTELARMLQLGTPSPAQEAALGRVLEAAAAEIDNHLGLTVSLAEPYPDSVVTVNLQMGEELWRQETNPHGVVVVAGDQAIYPGRTSWRRWATMLLPYKESNWGVG